MNILVLGGTGAMGGHLIDFLDNDYNDITVTSRRERSSSSLHVRYVKGNAKDLSFISSVLASEHYDAIVDFMAYTTAEFTARYRIFLEATEQYVFISSARVYAQCDGLIREDSPRLLDVSADKKYLKTDEYALAKARCEDLLRDSGCRNYTIIRPSITYDDYRLQLGVLEKENWLYRAMHGRSIVFSEDIASKLTAMTRGEDVAKGIASIIGRREALGEAFHITCSCSYTWREILDCYMQVLSAHGYEVKSVIVDKCPRLALGGGTVYQIIYCRYFNRSFDNTKIGKFVDVDAFTPPLEGLASCLDSFLKNPSFKSIDWVVEALDDRVSGEKTPYSEIPTMKGKLTYFCYRHRLGFMIAFMRKVVSRLKA